MYTIFLTIFQFELHRSVAAQHIPGQASLQAIPPELFIHQCAGVPRRLGPADHKMGYIHLVTTGTTNGY